jgi:hypothetical protein
MSWEESYLAERRGSDGRSGDGSRTQRQLRTPPDPYSFLFEITHIQPAEPTRPEPNIRRDLAQGVTEITAASTRKR